MKDFKKGLVVLAVCLGFMARSSGAVSTKPDVWTLVSNTDPGKTYHIGQHIGSFFAGTAGTYPWAATVNDYFTCTGDSTNAPAWTLLYQALANNNWYVTNSGTITVGAGYNAYYCRDYYTETGTETFQDTTTMSLASRTVNICVDDSNSPCVVAVYGGSGSGGGQ